MDGPASQLIPLRTDAADRLVQGHVKLAFGADGPAIHCHLVMEGINLGSEQPHQLAVDADAPGQNDLFTRAARSHASVGKKFLKTNHDELRIGNCGFRIYSSAFAAGNPQSVISNPK